jgi:predicted nucleic acid-binding protein
MKQMHKKIFFDANVLIDLINGANDFNDMSLILFTKIRMQKTVLYVSPTSFGITYYFISKNISNKKLGNKIAVDFFSPFIFTKEDNLMMEKVKKSSFSDLEDALQYFSALDSGVDAIITKNHFDFSRSTIPVYHPLQFINEFLL